MALFKELLKTTGLSQARLAEILEINPRTVNRWAVGKLPAPKAVSLYLTTLLELKALQTRFKDELPQD